MGSLNIGKAKVEDLPRILQIYECARNFMSETGNPSQWKNNFPPETLLIQDINAGQLYVLSNESDIHAVFAFIIGEDPTYSIIEQGEWLSDSEYGTLHRIAGDGVIHSIFDIIVEYCEQEICHLRIDTHKNNKVMQHLIKKNGFQKCGIIHIADGTERIAYEKLII